MLSDITGSWKKQIYRINSSTIPWKLDKAIFHIAIEEMIKFQDQSQKSTI